VDGDVPFEQEESESVLDREMDPITAKYGFIVPWVLLVMAMVIMFGAGITVKVRIQCYTLSVSRLQMRLRFVFDSRLQFFPIFFLHELHIDPMTVNITDVFIPLTTAFMTLLCTYISTFFGRLQTSFVVFGLAVAGLIAMAEVRIPVLVLIIDVFRSSFANACDPLFRSVTMEYVPKKNRGKWSALESLIGTVSICIPLSPS
jgi:hypothetical protein